MGPVPSEPCRGWFRTPGFFHADTLGPRDAGTSGSWAGTRLKQSAAFALDATFKEGAKKLSTQDK